LANHVDHFWHGAWGVRQRSEVGSQRTEAIH